MTAVLATDPSAGQEAAIGLAVRTFAEPLVEQLPVPWSTALGDAARARLADLPGALRRTVAHADVELRTPWSWRLFGALRWIAALGVLVGIGWLAIRGGGLGLGVPVLLVADGVVIFLVVTLLTRPFVAAGARAARSRAERRLRAMVTSLTREYVVGPVRDVLTRYAQARDALDATRR